MRLKAGRARLTIVAVVVFVEVSALTALSILRRVVHVGHAGRIVEADILALLAEVGRAETGFRVDDPPRVFVACAHKACSDNTQHDT